MKKNLGRVLTLLLTLETLLLSSPLASYKLFSNKTQAYTKEAVKVTFVASQKDHTDLMFFLLKPQKSPDYKIQLLKKTNADKRDHYAQTSFTYLLFPLTQKDIDVHFQWSVQTASDSAVAQSYIDDHDGGKAIQSNTTQIAVEPLHIKIKKIPTGVDLVGDFKLTAHCDTQETTEYKDINLVYTLEGEGYIGSKKKLLPSQKGVNSFSEIHDTYKLSTEHGYKIKRVYTYALSAKHNFSIAPLHLKVFSPTKNQVYSLNTPAYAIHVTQIDPLSLLDNKNSPQVSHWFSGENFKDFFIYTLLFVSGFLTAKFTEIEFKSVKKEQKFQDIKATTKPQELIMLLLSKYRQMYIEDVVEELEELQYGTSSKNFTQIKSELLKKLTLK